MPPAGSGGGPRFDVAVVGGGVVGCLTAWEILARSPESTVVILERDGVGGGATLRSAALHFPRGGTERVRRMSRYSQTWWEGLSAAYPELPIHPVGMSVVAAATSRARVRRNYLDTADLVETDGVPVAAIRIPDDATVWSGRGCHYSYGHGVTQTLARQLRGRAAVREGVRVVAVEPTAHGVVLRLGTGETLTAGRVVLAPGPWSADAAWRDLVAPLGVRIKKVVALHLDVAPAEGDGVVVFDDEDAFLLPLRYRGHWLLSYTCQEWDVDPDGLTAGLSDADLAAARDVLGRYAPGLIERCTGGRVFCDAYSVEREPIVRALDDAGRIVFAGAANGSGYRLAPAIAAECVDLLTTNGGDAE
ncbi:FAD-dependent oxidoreductase [Micromonospora matsumotoense]|uniref:NAD(P)/FAD-dependent oxidoreductase n=1 Tax=Micromonospora matsumotoense TaxID=121616 RepID=UPI0034353E38